MSYQIGTATEYADLLNQLDTYLTGTGKCLSPQITGAELYAFAQQAAAEAGWNFGGAIAGLVFVAFTDPDAWRRALSLAFH